MKKTFSIRDARRNFSQLIVMVEQGEDIVITRRARPVARIIGVKKQSSQFPDRRAFRASIKASKTPSVLLLRQLRDER